MSAPKPTNDPRPPLSPLLHVYAQRSHHDEAYVLGTRTGLRALANAITEALQSPTGHAQALLLTGDGTGRGVSLAQRGLL